MAKINGRVSCVRIYSGTTTYEIKTMDGRYNYKYSQPTPAGMLFSLFMPRDVVKFKVPKYFGEIKELPELVERDKKFLAHLVTAE